MNKVILIGRVGEIYPSKNPDVCNMTVATSNSWKDKSSGEWKSDTEWHRIICFKHNAEKARGMSKGEHIYVEGEIKTNKWTDKTGIEKESKEIRSFLLKSMMNKKQKEELKGSSDGNVVEQKFDDDDIPF